MNDMHITHILDERPLVALSETDLASIRAHTGHCVECARAFEAAQLSELLMRERAAETAADTLNANPFFQTRVLAAWREQQTTVGGWNLRRLWNATGAVVSSMVVTTAALAVLTFIVPAEEPTPVQTVAVASASAESVMFDQSEEEMTNEQALSAIYYDEEEAR